MAQSLQQKLSLAHGDLLALVGAAPARVAPRPRERSGKLPGQEILGPDGGRMVWVPPGEFDMGQEGVETPVHHVRISRGFWLGQCPVTNAQY
jgi:formylglycine-generating enzyme required for sulfatase activity